MKDEATNALAIKIHQRLVQNYKANDKVALYD